MKCSTPWCRMRLSKGPAPRAQAPTGSKRPLGGSQPRICCQVFAGTGRNMVEGVHRPGRRSVQLCRKCLPQQLPHQVTCASTKQQCSQTGAACRQGWLGIYLC